MKILKIGLMTISLLLIIVLSNIAVDKIGAMPSDMYLNYQEIEQANKDRIFGNFVKLDLSEDDISTDTQKTNNGEVTFKLFGFIPIKKMSVKILPEEEAYIGGNIIGLEINSDGAVVVSDTVINSQDGSVKKNRLIESGDIIQQVNGDKINSASQLVTALQQIDANAVELTLLRHGKEHTLNVPLIKDDEKHKLGIWVKDDFAGVGTLTFVMPEDKSYGALGHAISNGDESNIIPITEGDIFECSVVNIAKGEKNKPGELQCVFLDKQSKGKIDKNTNVGIFGKLTDVNELVDVNNHAKLGGRLSVKPGKAKLISCVSGIQEGYDIEIIKVNNQNSSDDKSFVFRVKDDRLLKLTGGIVQGMSGSPIMQNDKIVGAVTHVFISDASKGYGVYTDWMLENLQQKRRP